MIEHALAAVVSINPNIPGVSNVSSAGPAGWIKSFYLFALLFSGVLAFGAMIFGAFKAATSAGNASKISEGRSWIWSSLIGLLLLAAAYLILNTVNPNLTQLQNPNLSNGGSITQLGPAPQLTSTAPPNTCGGSTPGSCPTGLSCQVITGSMVNGRFVGTYGCQ